MKAQYEDEKDHREYQCYKAQNPCNPEEYFYYNLPKGAPLGDSAIKISKEEYNKGVRSNNLNHNLNFRDEDGNTTLHIAAAKHNSLNIQNLLNDKGLDINALNKQNETPLFIAIQHRNIEEIEILVKNGANLEVLESQTVAGHTNIIKFNEDTRLYFYPANDPAHSPVHALIKSDLSIEDLQLLLPLFLKYGADINVKNEQGLTPFGLADQFQQPQSCKLLLQYGAKIPSDTIISPFILSALNPLIEKVMIFDLLCQHKSPRNLMELLGTLKNTTKEHAFFNCRFKHLDSENLNVFRQNIVKQKLCPEHGITNNTDTNHIINLLFPCDTQNNWQVAEFNQQREVLQSATYMFKEKEVYTALLQHEQNFNAEQHGSRQQVVTLDLSGEGADTYH